MPEHDLAAALEAHRRGDHPRAQALIGSLLALHAQDARVLHLAGEVAAQDGRLDEACVFLERALALAPGAAEVRFSLGRARWRAGMPDAAREHLLQVVERLPHFAPASLLLALVESSAGDEEAARRAVVKSGAAEVGNFPARDLAVKACAEEVKDGRCPLARWATRPVSDDAPRFTVAICSIDEAKLARARESVERSDPRPAQWIVIRDAHSLAEAFNRAIDRATGDAILFMHDDVEVLSKGVFGALGRALAASEVAGVAGSLQLSGPTIGWSGQEHARGALAHGSSAQGHYDYSVLNWTDRLATGMQALDGCFIAARAGAARAIRFDADMLDGFHLYDLDFAYRAALSGLHVAVTSEVVVAHASRGTLSGGWDKHSRRFLGKFPALAGHVPRPSHFYAARVSSPRKVLALHAEMRGLAGLLERAP